jgi:hypothetical protein
MKSKNCWSIVYGQCMDGGSGKERSPPEPNSVYLAGSRAFHRFDLERISPIEKELLSRILSLN